jgi:simple sugar transport system ATP-binding protein
LLADLMVYENYGITDLAAGRFGGWFRVARRRMRAAAEMAIESHRIFGCNPTTRTRLLSGGNAQKLLLARELGSGMAIIVAHSPTRGLDVQASLAVHALLLQAARDGAACILISEDLEEILALSTRVAVMSRGRIVGEFPIDQAKRSEIGSLMLGHA